MAFLQQLVEQLVQQAHDHSMKIVTAAVLMALGWFFGRRRARAEWRNRQFYDLINFSLNIVQDGKLFIRTIAEKRCSEVFLNPAACDAVMAAAKKTTVADAILPLPDEDYWYYLNYVLNELSEQFNEAYLRRDLGVPVRSAVYLIALTREADGGVRSQKIRAMLVRKDLIEKIAAAQDAKANGGEGQEVAMEVLRENHKTRVKTLNHMAMEYKKRPGRFLEIELGMSDK
jgi:hypothetical protein